MFDSPVNRSKNCIEKKPAKSRTIYTKNTPDHQTKTNFKLLKCLSYHKRSREIKMKYRKLFSKDKWPLPCLLNSTNTNFPHNILQWWRHIDNIPHSAFCFYSLVFISDVLGPFHEAFFNNNRSRSSPGKKVKNGNREKNLNERFSFRKQTRFWFEIYNEKNIRPWLAAVCSEWVQAAAFLSDAS